MRAIFKSASVVSWRFAKPLVILAVFVVLWSVVLTLAVKSGFLWDVLSPRLAADQRYGTQNLVMSTADTAKRVLVIGDSAFVARLRKTDDARSDTEFLTIDALDPDDITTALSAIARHNRKRENKVQFCRLVLQVSPYFVARMRDRGSRQDVTYLRALEQKSPPFIPNRSTKTFFQTLTKWARTRPAKLDTSDPQRPPDFPPQISTPDPNLENWTKVERQLRNSAVPVVVVADRRFSDYARAPRLLGYFDRDFRDRIVRGQETSGLTTWAEFSDLRNLAWATCPSS